MSHHSDLISCVAVAEVESSVGGLLVPYEDIVCCGVCYGQWIGFRGKILIGTHRFSHETHRFSHETHRFSHETIDFPMKPSIFPWNTSIFPWNTSIFPWNHRFSHETNGLMMFNDWLGLQPPIVPQETHPLRSRSVDLIWPRTSRPACSFWAQRLGPPLGRSAKFSGITLW